MAEVPVTMNGMLYDLFNRTTQRVVFIGDASLTGLGVGGGPMPPGPGQPPSGGPPGLPVHPIWGPPGIELPPGPGYPPVAGHPLPPPGGGTPPAPIANWEAKPVWTESTGWAVVLVPVGGQPVPTPSKG